MLSSLLPRRYPSSWMFSPRRDRGGGRLDVSNCLRYSSVSLFCFESKRKRRQTTKKIREGVLNRGVSLFSSQSLLITSNESWAKIKKKWSRAIKRKKKESNVFLWFNFFLSNDDVSNFPLRRSLFRHLERRRIGKSRNHRRRKTGET